MRMIIAIAVAAISAAAPGHAQDAQKTEQARSDLFNLADAKPNEVEKVKTFCKGMNLAIDGQLKGDKAAAGVVQNCKVLGYL